MSRFPTRTEVTGTVTRYKQWTAIVHTDEGDSLILRRIGLNSLRLDKDFIKLVGHRVRFKGKQARQFFFATSWYNAEGA